MFERLRKEKAEWQSAFKIGDKVTVVKNSERTFAFSFVGRRGKIIGFKSDDAIIRFGNNEHDIAYITISDLAHQNDERDMKLLQ